MILAIDLGNYNIKTSEEIIFNSKFSEGLSENPIGEEFIKYDNKYYTMTKGEFDIVLGGPLDNLGISNNFKEELENKDFEFEYNNKGRKKSDVIKRLIENEIEINKSEKNNICKKDIENCEGINF